MHSCASVRPNSRSALAASSRPGLCPDAGDRPSQGARARLRGTASCGHRTSFARPAPAALGAALAALLAATPAVEACSILTLRDADTVLMGNNEDWLEPGVVWFVPGKRGRYGRVNFGFDDDFAQGSMNEKGLSFDAAALGEVPWSPDPDKRTPRNLVEKIMNECATVAEALEYFERYNTPFLKNSQFLFADATGDSAVVAWLPETGLSIERIEGSHQVITNTRVEASEYRCRRYVRAERMLAEQAEASVEGVASVLSAVRQWGEAFTSYSTIYDLKRRQVHVYDLGNFDEKITLDLAQELEKRPPTRALRDLFANSPDLEEIRARPQRQDFGTRAEISTELLEKYAGTYSPPSAPEVRVQVIRDGDGLRVENPGQPTARLVAESETSFRIVPDRGQVTFRVGADGRVEGLTLHKQIDVWAERVDEAPAGS